MHVERTLSAKSIDNPTLRSCLFVRLGVIPDDLGHIRILGLFDESGVLDALVVVFDTFLPFGSIGKRRRLAPRFRVGVLRRDEFGPRGFSEDRLDHSRRRLCGCGAHAQDHRRSPEYRVTFRARDRRASGQLSRPGTNHPPMRSRSEETQ